MSDAYFSISGESHGVYREKASKFMAFAFPVSNEEEIHERLQTVKKEYHDASHHCFAYRLGINGEQYRTFDDGEPSGSAGKPILGQLVSLNLSDVLVIVIRYFGGTKLGIPGLINAYRVSAREALEKAGVVEKHLVVTLRISFGFGVLNEVMKILKNPKIEILEKKIDQECSLVFSMRQSMKESIIERLKHLSGQVTYVNLREGSFR